MIRSIPILMAAALAPLPGCATRALPSDDASGGDGETGRVATTSTSTTTAEGSGGVDAGAEGSSSAGGDTGPAVCPAPPPPTNPPTPERVDECAAYCAENFETCGELAAREYCSDDVCREICMLADNPDLECRSAHLMLAQRNRDPHCPFAGLDGDGICNPMVP